MKLMKDSVELSGITQILEKIEYDSFHVSVYTLEE